MIKGDINHHSQVSNQHVPIMAEKNIKDLGSFGI